MATHFFKSKSAAEKQARKYLEIQNRTFCDLLNSANQILDRNANTRALLSDCHAMINDSLSKIIISDSLISVMSNTEEESSFLFKNYHLSTFPDFDLNSYIPAETKLALVAAIYSYVPYYHLSCKLGPRWDDHVYEANSLFNFIQQCKQEFSYELRNHERLFLDQLDKNPADSCGWSDTFAYTPLLNHNGQFYLNRTYPGIRNITISKPKETIPKATFSPWY